MIFLKKFIATGFKSFATKSEINFNHQMSGIVGPNGSGKSNIVDAIKWVLGEKSNKELRGKISEDIIFHGSKEHEPAKSAQITLIFDNSNHVLHIDSPEAIITRKLVKGKGSNEYYLNNEPCRLKDIQDIFLDTGLSKGSLGIISQGTVQWFVDAKPEERRTIFEDAAGIGLYTKKRNEANRTLEKTTENLNRISDITNELSNQLKKLQHQADKAKIYQAKHKELKQLDLTMLVKDLKYFTNKVKQVESDVQIAKDKLLVYEPNIKELTQSIQFAKQKQDIAEKNLDLLNSEFNNLIDQLNKLEIKKTSLNSSLQTDLNSENLTKRIDAYKALIQSTKFTIEDAKNNIAKLTDSTNTYQKIIDELINKRNLLKQNVESKNTQIVETRTKIKQLVDFMNSRNSLAIGVRTILENKKALTGICGTVSDFVNCDQKYRLMLDTALGKAASNVIVEKTLDAEAAVDFLKTNRAGKATFLPLETIKPKCLRPEHFEIIQNHDGYVDIANNLVNFDNKYANIYAYLLGNIIVAEDLQNAFVLSKLTYQLYKVITLDGDLISPGGAVTGGYSNKDNLVQIANPNETLNKLNQIYPRLTNEQLQLKSELDKVLADLNDISAKQSERKILISKYEETLRINDNQLVKYESDYQQLLKQNDIDNINDIKSNSISIDEEIAKLTARKNKVTEDLNINRNNRTIYKSQVNDYEQKLNEIRFQLDAARDIVSKYEVDLVKCKSIIESAKNHINVDYKMTIEFAMANYNNELPMSDQEARTAIEKLRDEIGRLGSINMDALNELNTNQERYDEMVKQQKDLQDAKTNIEKAINELDAKAEASFTATIDKVNQMLPDVFKYLFGGGTCKIEYTDPANVLTSGIDVTVAPFGKNVTRLSLLSGGEKSLVALSILFTILKFKAFPLVILDEAESALDPVNVERFANMVKSSSKQTQFAVITHRPGTMEKCDILYGATMQTKGVTSMYIVELSQAQQEYGSDKQE